MISAIKLSDLCGQSVRRRAAYSITPTRNGCTILTKDGREFHSVFNLAKELEDDAEIRAVVPCHGVAALYYLGDNQTEIRPCPLMYLPVRRFS